MGKVAMFFAGVCVADGVIALVLSPGTGMGLALILLVIGVFLAGSATGRLIKIPGESWVAWAFGLLGASLMSVLYAVNAMLSLVGMGSNGSWEKTAKAAAARKQAAKAVPQTTATRPTKSYDAAGNYVGQSFDGKSYNASGDYTGQVIDGKHYDAAGDYTGQVIDGKHYDASGNLVGQTVES